MKSFLCTDKLLNSDFHSIILRSGALNLTGALTVRFRQGGQEIDLDKVISLHRQALDLRPPPHPYRPSSLNNLATTLWT